MFFSSYKWISFFATRLTFSHLRADCMAIQDNSIVCSICSILAATLFSGSFLHGDDISQYQLKAFYSDIYCSAYFRAVKIALNGQNHSKWANLALPKTRTVNIGVNPPSWYCNLLWPCKKRLENGIAAPIEENSRIFVFFKISFFPGRPGGRGV